MLQLLGGRWERNPAAEQRICGRSRAQYALAERIGVQRTSLSRELAKMREDGLIEFNSVSVTLLNKFFE